jgi:hypothetical protein
MTMQRWSVRMSSEELFVENVKMQLLLVEEEALADYYYIQHCEQARRKQEFEAMMLPENRKN